MPTTIEYSLFRLAFVRPKQGVLTADNLTAQELILEAITARPARRQSNGVDWRIGNVELFTNEKGYFALGKITTKSVERFDEESGDFVAEDLEQSPFTPCVFDASIGIVCIAKKSILSQTTEMLARRLSELLSNTDAAIRNHINVEVRPIRDPGGFLSSLARAYRVIKFTATFKGPNPFDADEYFQRPLAVYLNAANGTKGTASIVGDELDQETLRDVTRSTVATGNEASARIQPTQSNAKQNIYLRGGAIKRSFPEVESSPRNVLKVLTTAYEEVRSDDN